MKSRLFFVFLLLLASAAFLPDAPAQNAPREVDPALADEMDEYAVVQVYDPLEKFNRGVFKFNDTVYNYVLRPVSRGYQRTVPATARRGLSNFFSNLRFPIRFVSELLQGKFGRAGREAERFYVNTVAGLGGFIRISDDVPALANLPSEDLGQTFGVWGFHRGPYLVLPLLGPGTVRDAVGGVGDYFLNPMHWDPFKEVPGHRWYWDTALQTTDTVNSIPELLGIYDAERKAALDPYVGVRSAYIQYRDAAVKQ
jgi:phospholipid-binding lipoprotein MlaA